MQNQLGWLQASCNQQYLDMFRVVVAFVHGRDLLDRHLCYNHSLGLNLFRHDRLQIGFEGYMMDEVAILDKTILAV